MPVERFRPTRASSLYRVISVISVVLQETTLNILTGEPVSMESAIIRVVSLSTSEISKTT